MDMFAICNTKTMALSTLNKLLSPVSLVVSAMLHSSFVADSVSVNKEAKTEALLNWKASIENETQPLLSSWTLPPNNATNSSNDQNTSSIRCSWFSISCSHAGSVIKLNLTQA